MAKMAPNCNTLHQNSKVAGKKRKLAPTAFRKLSTTTFPAEVGSLCKTFMHDSYEVFKALAERRFTAHRRLLLSASRLVLVAYHQQQQQQYCRARVAVAVIVVDIRVVLCCRVRCIPSAERRHYASPGRLIERTNLFIRSSPDYTLHHSEPSQRVICCGTHTVPVPAEHYRSSVHTIRLWRNPRDQGLDLEAPWGQNTWSWSSFKKNVEPK